MRILVRRSRDLLHNFAPFAPVQAVCRLIPNHRLHLRENGRLQVDDSIGQTHPDNQANFHG